MREIKKIIIKTICAALPYLHHHYSVNRHGHLFHSVCFQLLGFDILLQHKQNNTHNYLHDNYNKGNKDNNYNQEN
jgi:hypothetical protein